MRPFQESHHHVSVGAAVGPGAGDRPPDLVSAQLDLQRSAGEPTVLIHRRWSLSVSGDMMMLTLKFKMCVLSWWDAVHKVSARNSCCYRFCFLFCLTLMLSFFQISDIFSHSSCWWPKENHQSVRKENWKCTHNPTRVYTALRGGANVTLAFMRTFSLCNVWNVPHRRVACYNANNVSSLCGVTVKAHRNVIRKVLGKNILDSDGGKNEGIPK